MTVIAGKWRRIPTPSYQISVLSPKCPTMTRSPSCHGATFIPETLDFVPPLPCPQSPALPLATLTPVLHLTHHALLHSSILILPEGRVQPCAALRHDLFKQ